MTKTVSNVCPTNLALGDAIRVALRRCRQLSVVSTAGTLLLGSVDAAAQTAPAPTAVSGTSQSVELAEVVVTAQRRSESIQNVPYNITAVDGTQLAQAGALTLDDLARVVPGLTTVDQGADARGRLDNLTLRGLNTESPGGGRAELAEGGQTLDSVATYFGETPVFFPMPLYDVDRVEVLRGPQGTLYGSSSEAGTIRFIPRRPSFDEISGEVSITGSVTERSSGDPNRDFHGFFNLPLADRLALRVVAGYEHSAGFIDDVDLWRRNGSGPLAVPIPSVPGNLTSGPVVGAPLNDANWGEKWFARAALRWQPVASVDLQLDYLHQHIMSADGQWSNPTYRGGGLDLSTPDISNGNVDQGIYPYSSFVARGGGNYLNTDIMEQPYADTIDLVSAVATVDLGLATVTSVTSYYDDDSDTIGDGTTPYFVIGGQNFLNSPTYLSYPRFSAPTPSIIGDWSVIEELRLVSSGEHRLDYIVGLYDQKEIGTTRLQQIAPGIQDYLSYIGQPNPSPLGDLVWNYLRRSEFTDKAVFGELTLHVTKAWQVTGGARFFRQDFSSNAINELPLCGVYCSSNLTNPLGLSTFGSSNPVSNHVFKLNTSYDLGTQTKVYATYSEGFRRGGANALGTTGPFASLPPYQTFAPDFSKNYEVGLKGTALDKRVRYSADVYWINLNNFQFNSITFSGLPATFNGSKATSKGTEIDVQAVVTDRLSATVGYAFTKAEVSKSFNIIDLEPYALVPAFGGTGQTGSIFGGPVPSGAKLPGVPEQTFTLSADYTVPLGWAGRPDWPLTLHADGAYRGSANAQLSETGLYSWTIPSSFTADARVSLETSKHVIYDFFVNNLTNETAYSGGGNVQAIPNIFAYRNVSRPRTWGLSVRLRL